MLKKYNESTKNSKTPKQPALSPLYLEHVQKALPSFVELVERDTQPKPTKRERGLFESLIGNPNVLYDDYLRSPQKYDERLHPLLVKLLQQTERSSLSSQDEDLLNQAVHDFLKKEPPAKKEEPVTPKQQYQQESQPKEYQHEEVFDENGLRPYWWV